MEITAQDRSALEQLEEALWREETRFDVAFMNKVLAPDFFEFGRSGRIHQRVDTLNASPQPIQAVLPLSNLAVRLLNDVTAQVTYNSAVTSGVTIAYGRRSSIWSKSASGWVLRFHQATPYQP